MLVSTTTCTPGCERQNPLAQEAVEEYPGQTPTRQRAKCTPWQAAGRRPAVYGSASTQRKAYSISVSTRPRDQPIAGPHKHPGPLLVPLGGPWRAQPPRLSHPFGIGSGIRVPGNAFKLIDLDPLRKLFRVWPARQRPVDANSPRANIDAA